MTPFSHLDRLGTSSRTTDGSGSVVDTKRYDAFGLPVQWINPSGSQKGFASAFGYQEDAESGLKLLGHRYYDAGSGRFITRDPIGSGMNWYQYADNNPLKQVDPTGYEIRDLTPDERTQVQAGIDQLRSSGNTFEADRLQYMLNHGRLKVDTDMADDAQTRYENIYLNPKLLTNPLHSSKRKKGILMEKQKNLADLIWLASILLHEDHHEAFGETSYNFVTARAWKPEDERMRWREQRNYLRRWLAIARKVGGVPTLIDYLEDSINRCNETIREYGGTP